MNGKAVYIWLAILFLFAGAMTLLMAARLLRPPIQSGQEEVVDYGPPLEKFELTDQAGDKFDSSNMDGQVWIASFFYTSCPSICVQQNLRVQQLEQELGHKGVKFVSISCDGATDTPRRLREYAERFNADQERWTFLTGDQKYLERVGADIFKLPVERRFHSERLMVIDRNGKIQGSFHYSNPAEIAKLKELVDKLLAAEPTAEESQGEDSQAETDATATEEEEKKDRDGQMP